MTIKNFKITWDDFLGPCYDPKERYGDCPITFLDLINDGRIPMEDRIWAFAYCSKIPDSIKRMLAVRCVREKPLHGGRFVFDLLTDERSKNAVLVAEKHALGEASDKDLYAAMASAMAASASANDAAWYAAMASAMAASASANDAAWYAAWYAAWDAAMICQLQVIISMITE